MPYTADRHIYVTLDHSRIIDPEAEPDQGSMLLLAAGQTVDDDTAKKLGLTGKGSPEAEAMRAHMWGGSAHAYNEVGGLQAAGGGVVPMGPGGVPAAAAAGAAPLGTPPGGSFAAEDEVEDVMRRSGVSRASAERLLAADKQSFEGHLAQRAVYGARAPKSEAKKA